MSSPSLVWVTEDGSLAIGDMPSVGGYRGRRAALQAKHTLPLALAESVLEVMCLLSYTESMIELCNVPKCELCRCELLLGMAHSSQLSCA